MTRKRVLIAAAGAAGLIALAAAGFALAPGHRGLAELDGNGDGRIVNAEIQQGARRRFAELDDNGDGRLTGDEWPRGRHGRRGRHGHPDRHADGVAPPPAAPGAEATQDGAAPAAQAQPAAPPAPPRRGLAAADTDGDSAINLREFYAHFSARITPADVNRDGVISAEEVEAQRAERHGRGL